jgi:hypothetical protein
MIGPSTTRRFLAGGAERVVRIVSIHPVAATVVLALFVRAAVAVGVFVTSGGTLFDDDVRYLEVARALAEGVPAAPRFVRQTGAFVLPLAGALLVGGGSILAGQLLSALAGAFVAGAATALGWRATGSVGWALAAGSVVALLPSQVLWSSLVLKDPFVWLCVSIIGIGVANGPPFRGRGFLAPVVVGMVGLGFLRAQTAVVAGVALLATTLLVGRRGAWPAALLVLALLVGGPWAGGYGPAGWGAIESGTNAAAIRAKTAEGAATAVVEPASEESDLPSGLGVTHLPRGVSVYLLEPYPWQQSTSERLEPARWENLLVWYPLLAVAAAGVALEIRRRRWTSFLGLYGAGMTLVYALAEGNLGTAFRHRGEVVWVVAVFAAVGGSRLVGRLRPSPREGSTP